MNHCAQSRMIDCRAIRTWVYPPRSSSGVASRMVARNRLASSDIIGPIWGCSIRMSATMNFVHTSIASSYRGGGVSTSS